MRALVRWTAALTAAIAAASAPCAAWANAEGPGTPQATAANATFLAKTPAPPGGAAAVCVIDSGVDTDTDLGPALAGRVASLGGVPGDPSDQGATLDIGAALPKHGTYVAGVIASQIDGVGTNGIWPAARVYSNRVFAGGATAQVADYIRAMDWCSNHPSVRVINLSLSGLASATVLQRQVLGDKIDEVRGPLHNINLVAAAGNKSLLATVAYPANADGVLAVGATDVTGALTAFSNRGTGLDIATLGTGTCLTTPVGSALALGEGTSYAAPVVSAVLAAMRSYDPALTPDQAEAVLLDTADTIGGVKVLNAAKAFAAVGSLAGLAADMPATGLRRAATNPCQPPPAGNSAGGNGPAVAKGSPKQPPVGDPDPGAVDTGGQGTGAPIISVQVPKVDPLTGLRPRRPTLRSLTHHGGALHVRIGGYQAGLVAIYRVTYRKRGKTKTRTYRRRAATITIRVTDWTLLRLHLQRPGAGTSETLTVRPSQEF